MNNMFLKFIPGLHVFFLMILFSNTAIAVQLKPFQAKPDQVLVLYNLDWTNDVDGSKPGQDSKEVAEYYQKMHRDRASGKNPYLLGLKCVHGVKHLNDWKISETSQDNKDGIIYTGRGKGPKTGEWARDSRKVEIVINFKNNEEIDWESVSFFCWNLDGNKEEVVDMRVSGVPQNKGRQIIYPDLEPGKGRCYRFDAHELFNGTVTIRVVVKNMAGKNVKELHLKYYDRDDFNFSKFGVDGIVDEKHFQEDVAIPVKAFLENSEHPFSDGTELKDYILYIAVCHGLPFASEGVFGIERGITPRPHDHGDLGSLEQRLQTLYYGWGREIIPPVVSIYMSGGPGYKDGVRNHRITSAMRYSLFGKRWNPYMHPDTYAYLSGKKTAEFINFESFENERKKKPPFFFAYGVSRIDGQGPMESKRIIDYSIYASKYLRPEMQAENKNGTPSEKLLKAENENLWGGRELSSLGFISISKEDGLPFLKRKKNINRLNETSQNFGYEGYYPGGMDRTVVSHNGWNKGRSVPIWKQIDQGVTVSACGAPAYGGGPHITNATFWDNRILMKYLLRGRDLGECFLRSTFYVNWSTSLIGDPLYHPDLNKTIIDKIPPEADLTEISVSIVPSMGKYTGKITVPVLSTLNNPEVCLLTVFYSNINSGIEQESNSHPIYSTRPYAYLRDLEPDSTYTYRLILTDPYGNKTILSDPSRGFHFKTGAKKKQKAEYREVVRRGNNWELKKLKKINTKEQGTLTMDFIAGEWGLFPSFNSGNVSLKAKKYTQKIITASISIGCPEKSWLIKSPLKQGEKASMIIRWRRFPLTREVVLKAADGTEFTLLADVRTPWEDVKLKSSIIVSEKSGSKVNSIDILNDAHPASPSACQINIPDIDTKKWAKANAAL